jgi:hypothetical protein
MRLKALLDGVSQSLSPHIYGGVPVALDRQNNIGSLEPTLGRAVEAPRGRWARLASKLSGSAKPFLPPLAMPFGWVTARWALMTVLGDLAEVKSVSPRLWALKSM